MARPNELDTLGKRLLAARKHKKMNQTQVAEAAGIEQPAVSKIERGESAQTAAIGRLAAAVDVPVLWLESGTGPAPKWLGGDAGSGSELAASRYTSETITHKVAISIDASHPEGSFLLRLLTAAKGSGINVEVHKWKEPARAASTTTALGQNERRVDQTGAVVRPSRSSKKGAA